MNTFDVLSKETSIFGNWFLEASAGTGKTFTIEHLVIRLLLEGDFGLEHILVVTFTRAAARELKTRIRAKLEKALQEKEAFPYLNDVFNLEKIEQALLIFDQAQIFTIHGFCQKMLQEYAFEAGLGLKTEPWSPEEEKRESLFFFRTVIKNYSPSQRLLLLKRFRNDIDALAQAILKERPSSISFEDLLPRFNALLQILPTFPLEELFAQEMVHYKKMTDPDFLLQARFLETLITKKTCSSDELDHLFLLKPFFLEGLTPSNLKVKSLGHLLHKQLSFLRDTLFPFIEQMSDPLLILKDIAYVWKKEKKTLSLLKDKMSPDDILEKMEESLSNEACVKHIRQKYQAVIVDEFQDTDPVQWNIFEKLFLPSHMQAVYLVGDPKQSIYAFRQADIYTFLKASKQFSFHAHLDTNYRSEQGLIEILNRLFCSSPWIDLPALGTTLPVLPMKAGKQGTGAVHFFVAEGSMGRGKRWPSCQLEKDYLFPFIVQEIAKVYGHASIAILVKDRFQAHRVHAFLEEWKFPSSIQRGESLGSSLALTALQELVDALATQDISLTKKTLLGPLIGWTTEDLTEENIFLAREKFLHLGALLKEKGFGAFWGEFLETKWLHQSTLEYLVALPDLTLYHDIQEIVEKAILQKDPERISSFLKELKQSEVTDRILGESSGIQIMTIHASKGLEFDVVFALGLASRNTARDVEEEQELDAEKMRQLYVAMTRAKQKLYVPLIIDLDQKQASPGEASPIELFWDRVKPSLEEYEHTLLNKATFHLTPYHAAKEMCLFPPLPLPPPSSPEFILSFSSLSQKTSSAKNVPLHVLPLGAETGIILHRIFERALTAQSQIKAIVTEEIKGTLLANWAQEIVEIVEKTLTLPLTSFSLKDVAQDKMQQEMEFLFSTKTGLMKGYIDLFFEKDGKYFIIDWKTNYLESYDHAHLEQAMHEGDYFLQADIYAAALKKYLMRFDPRPFHECFGGVCYIFVRAPACFHFFQRSCENTFR